MAKQQILSYQIPSKTLFHNFDLFQLQFEDLAVPPSHDIPEISEEETEEDEEPQKLKFSDFANAIFRLRKSDDGHIVIYPNEQGTVNIKTIIGRQLFPEFMMTRIQVPTFCTDISSTVGANLVRSSFCNVSFLPTYTVFDLPRDSIRRSTYADFYSMAPKHDV